jgi:hypothetical protein
MKTNDILRQSALALAVTFAAGLLFVNIYNSVVDAPNWGHNLPKSIEATRAYFSVADPGKFFRIASPINQVLAVLALIACWKVDRRLRWLCAAAALFAIAGDMMTFAYFYPRNDIMFRSPVAENLDAIRAAHAQWSAMNWVRSVIVGLGLIMNMLAFARLSSLRSTQTVSLPRLEAQASAA